MNPHASDALGTPAGATTGAAARSLGVDRVVADALLCMDTYLGYRRTEKLAGRVRRWNLARLLARLEAEHGPAGPPPEAVPTRTAFDPEAFSSEFRRPGRPVVLKGLAAGFPAVARWSPAFFREHYGDVPVVTVDGSQRALADLEAGAGSFHTEAMTVREQVDRMLAGRTDYVSFFGDLFSRDPGLCEDIPLQQLEPLLSRKRFAANPLFKLFMGASGTSTPWHCAELQNLFVQIHGRKDWVLAPPSSTPCLDPRITGWNQQYCHAMIDFRAPDLERFPLYRHTQLFHASLEPGDLLYIPPFWWHYVVNPTVSIGLALWWPNVLPALRANPTLFFLTVLSPQHLLRRAWERLSGRDAQTQVSTSSILGPHMGGSA